MQLTEEQIKTLDGVNAGIVLWYEPLSIRQPGYTKGARKDVLESLEKMGAITKPNVNAGDFKPYKITKMGRQLLERP